MPIPFGQDERFAYSNTEATWYVYETAVTGAVNGYGDTVAFIYVVQHGGFTAAAKATGMSKARISRNVRELEDRLGTPLLKRSTRRLGLTEAGKVYFEE